MTESSLNRNEILEIVGEPPTARKVRAVEDLFTKGSIESTESRVELGSVDAKVNQAVATGIDVLRRSKGNSVLTWLSM